MEDPQPSSSRHLARAENSVTDIPHDVTLEILSKLPAKSLIRFQSVSKLWSNIITSKDCADAFLNRSTSRPRLLMSYNVSGHCFIFSAPDEHQDNHDHGKFSKVSARHDTTVSDTNYYRIHCPPVNGFLCCRRRGARIAVCNPTTKQTVELPRVDLKGIRYMYARLGHDPVEDQYKVLCIVTLNREHEHLVCTVRSGRKLEWRKIHTISRDLNYNPSQGICTGGAIYYCAGRTTIARFDVRSEKFDYIQGLKAFAVESFSKLVTYQGKLAVASYDDCILKFQIRLRILQDAEKHEWSSIITCDVPRVCRCLCTGESHTNEILMIPNFVELSCVYYCNMVTKRVRRVEVDGIDDAYKLGVLYFPSYVENITFL